jgi:hypothetical protein
MVLNELHEVPAGVVEDCSCHWTEFDRVLREGDTQAGEPGVFGNEVIHEERGEGDAVVDQGGLERLRRWMPVGFEHELRAVGVAGETTVSQRCSPMGISVFFTKPRTRV